MRSLLKVFQPGRWRPQRDSPPRFESSARMPTVPSRPRCNGSASKTKRRARRRRQLEYVRRIDAVKGLSNASVLPPPRAVEESAEAPATAAATAVPRPVGQRRGGAAVASSLCVVDVRRFRIERELLARRIFPPCARGARPPGDRAHRDRPSDGASRPPRRRRRCARACSRWSALMLSWASSASGAAGARPPPTVPPSPLRTLRHSVGSLRRLATTLSLRSSCATPSAARYRRSCWSGAQWRRCRPLTAARSSAPSPLPSPRSPRFVPSFRRRARSLRKEVAKLLSGTASGAARRSCAALGGFAQKATDGLNWSAASSARPSTRRRRRRGGVAANDGADDEGAAQETAVSFDAVASFVGREASLGGGAPLCARRPARASGRRRRRSRRTGMSRGTRRPTSYDGRERKGAWRRRRRRRRGGVGARAFGGGRARGTSAAATPGRAPPNRGRGGAAAAEGRRGSREAATESGRRPRRRPAKVGDELGDLRVARGGRTSRWRGSWRKALSVALWNLDAAHAARSRLEPGATRPPPPTARARPSPASAGLGERARVLCPATRLGGHPLELEKRLRIVCSWFCFRDADADDVLGVQRGVAPEAGAWWAMSTSSIATEATASRRARRARRAPRRRGVDREGVDAEHPGCVW